MDHRLMKAPTFSTVYPNGTAVCKIPGGNRRYRGFFLEFKNNGVLATEQNFRDLLTNVAIKINGTKYYDISAADLIDTQMKFKDRSFVAGQIMINFSDDYQRTMALEDVLSLDTLGLATVDLEVDIAAGAVNPQLALYTFEDAGEVDATGKPISVFNNRLFKRVTTFTYETSGAVEKEIADLPKSVGNITAIHILSMEDNAIDNFKIEADNVKIYDAPLEVNKQLLSEVGTRKPQSKWVHYDPVVLDRVTDSLNIEAINDFRLKIKTNKATALRVVYETVQLLPY